MTWSNWFDCNLQYSGMWHFPSAIVFSLVASSLISWKSVLTDTFLHFVANETIFHSIIWWQRETEITRKANQNFFNSMATRTKVATVASHNGGVVCCIVGNLLQLSTYAFVVLRQTPSLPPTPSLMQLFRHFDTFELVLQPVQSLLPPILTLILQTQYLVRTFVCDTSFRGKSCQYSENKRGYKRKFDFSAYR